MLAKKVDGIILEKLEKSVLGQNGSTERKFYLRLVQKGSRGSIDINCSENVYNSFSENELISLDDVTIGSVGGMLWAKLDDEYEPGKSKSDEKSSALTGNLKK